MAGPLIGSALVALISMGGAFIANGLSFLYIAFVISRAVLISQPRRSATPTKAPYMKDVRRGWEYAVARTAILGALAFFGLVAPIQQMLPTVAATNGQSVGHLGILLSAIAAGGIIANPFIRRGTRRGVDECLPCRHRDRDQWADLGPPRAKLQHGFRCRTPRRAGVLVGMPLGLVPVRNPDSAAPDITGHMLGLFFSVVTLGTALGSVLLGYLIDSAGARLSPHFGGTARLSVRESSASSAFEVTYASVLRLIRLPRPTSQRGLVANRRYASGGDPQHLVTSCPATRRCGEFLAEYLDCSAGRRSACGRPDP